MAPYRRPPRKLSQRCYLALEKFRENHEQLVASDPVRSVRDPVRSAPVNYTNRPFKISEQGREAIERLAAQAEAKHVYFEKTG